MSNEKDLEQLLKIAALPWKDEKKKPRDPARSNAHYFIKDLDIKRHEQIKVPATLIFDRYISWCALKGETPETLVRFFQNFEIYFKKERNKNVSYYYIVPDKIDLSAENIARVSLDWKRISNVKKTKKKNARQA